MRNRDNGPEGVRLLTEFLRRKGLTLLDLGEAISVGRTTCHGWLASGNRPSVGSAILLEAASGGAVPASSWLRGTEVTLYQELLKLGKLSR